MTFRNMAFLMAVATAMVAKAQTERKMTVDDLFQLVESNSKTLRQEKISVEFASISRLRLVNNSAASNSGSWLWDNIWKSSSSKIVSR